MNRDIAKQWALALESGKYQQGQRQLAYTPADTGITEYCCLGVLCELAIDAGVPIEHTVSEGVTGAHVYNGAVSLPPTLVAAWAGMNSRDGQVFRHSVCTTLAKENDNGASFPEIAHLVRGYADIL